MAPWLPRDGVMGVLVHLALAALVLLVCGAAADSRLGRSLGALADRVIGKIPGVRTVYRGVQKLVAGFTGPAADSRKVVLIQFPSPSMKAVGLVTRRLTAQESGQELAAVYVPTTPNPSSGYIEIVPVDELVWLDWTANEAIQFIVSGGVVGPDTITFEPNGARAVAAQ